MSSELQPQASTPHAIPARVRPDVKTANLSVTQSQGISLSTNAGQSPPPNTPASPSIPRVRRPRESLSRPAPSLSGSNYQDALAAAAMAAFSDEELGENLGRTTTGETATSGNNSMLLESSPVGSMKDDGGPIPGRQPSPELRSGSMAPDEVQKIVNKLQRTQSWDQREYRRKMTENLFTVKEGEPGYESAGQKE